ncbi:MAG: excinuclease ABC subunit UvrA [Ignavibacteriales bacterium]|nr:excinuclease ABC subunit UvrA [Ignavibacteriales bacterium]MCF8316470.1 excinuclease ABC subunit UvrA [Ignavibacteriales bacterium]MCF8437950.1 excinuclease ABC subunit UvrA [Ignavibacteriales bacterium]
MTDKNYIIVKGAREHNLKNIDIEIPRNKMIVFTGVSGSGKSSLVYDTIYAEGQRRYVESLSSYARQFLERMNKPNVDFIKGISPAVAIEQKQGGKNPRSTVGTSTELYDFLRLLFARIGKTICFNCGKEVKKDTVSSVVHWLMNAEEKGKFLLGFPIHPHEGRSPSEEIEHLKKRGYFRIWYKNEVFDLGTDKPKIKDKEIVVILDRFVNERDSMRERIAESIEIGFREGEGHIVIVNAGDNLVKSFSTFYECCGIKYEEPEPRFFSFNNPYGACPVCQGFGRTIGYDMSLIIPDENISILDGAIAPWRGVKFSQVNRDLIRNAKSKGIPINVPFRRLTDEQVELIKSGFGDFEGINKFFEALESQTYKMHIRILLSKYRGYTTCSACRGSRIRREALQVRVGGLSIADIVSMPIEHSLNFFTSLQLTQYELSVGERILKEINRRLTFLYDVGLGYLTLERLSATLSGGETQRINLATSLGSALIGTLYVLDEPSIGLHPRDNARLINILKSLRDIGNTVLVVEHDTDMMKAADLIVDMGPRAGVHGGEIIAYQNYNDLLQNDKSLTGNYLSGKRFIPLPSKRRTYNTDVIKIEGARENNLKNIDVEFPLRKFVAVTGVSGSGKSTLVHDILYGGIIKNRGGSSQKIGKYDSITGYHLIDEIEIVDQSPIGKSPRSNPISYIKGFEMIRELFSDTHLARSRGYKPGFFSFNVPGGRCENCQGEGFVKIEMQFLADIYLECEECKGTRFKKEVREVTWRGKNIVEVLNMTAAEALEFFSGMKKIESTIRTLNDVGLGYIKLGQPSNTLSGGEAQRIKLALNLSLQKAGKHSLFIFDEPTTGLHFDDIGKLLDCFNMLLESGNSIVIIEHNLDIIKCADYVIEMGPEAGEKGGVVVVTGTPEEVAAHPDSHTGRFLKDVLK